jgi:hypothetical protein
MGKTKTSFEQAATYVTEATWDGCIDGSVNGSTVKFAIRMEGQGEFTRGEMKFKKTFKTTGNGEEPQKELEEK